ncbi:hypothetical protein FHL15_010822 [Xylaria flabelliformis]|uniref:Uncharacterized protein n=1 Tax=Xylaria flabelliformis TaxID=2512241 RepID=A0A553HK42_9PEZI|nr:hypothetical protein FHL15_010822 [Xylaria flabelliformis]
MPLLSLHIHKRICIKTIGEDVPLTRERDQKQEPTDSITINNKEEAINQSTTAKLLLPTTEAKMAVDKLIRTLTGKADKPLTPEEEAKKAAKKAEKEQKKKEKKEEEERKKHVEDRRRSDRVDRYQNH